MLVTQFDKFVNRSTQEILGDEIVQENLEPMLSTDIVRNGGAVTGVKGEKEIYYRTGNVNLTPADIGALNEENVYNGLDQTDSGYALDARQGKALNEVIGHYMTLLWTNTSLLSEFGPQTVALDLSEYKAVLIRFAEYTDIPGRDTLTPVVVPVNDSMSNIVICPYANGSKLEGFSVRTFNVSTTTGIYFANAYNLVALNNWQCVPYDIYGLV